ncbi:MAG: type II CRISPR RNA-guided endonuclease Cas9 [Beijerinckiaceae bacterium]|nr:type II CRISPR RNA-guided endonuclease Cas9 [Beijerinckiaceae bacterium]MCI0735168.1 type II CRISPR RNA-guided endonuclease Cas9 [Beijerinckiaceae bacterium]
MRIFGFDIGTTSIGFAVIDLNDEAESGKILRLGARIFPEARDPDGTPLNQQRRAKRMTRRQLRRRRERRRALNEHLAAHGLLPAFNSPEWARIMAFDPYELRARGLTAPLSSHELGRALYHLSKRRHFKERDLSEAENEKGEKDKPAQEEEAEAKTREATVAALRQSGETLGSHLAKISPLEPKRGIHATRAIVREEFERLCAAQAAYHPVLTDPNFSAALEEAIFAQRPVFWRKSTLGACRFMPGEDLCQKGSWLSQQRRMLEKVNNLAIAGGNARPLDEDERAAILAALATQKSMGWPGARKTLEPLFKARGESAKYVRFNLEYGDEKGGLKGNVVEADLAKIFGSNWAAHPHKEALRTFVPGALWQADYGEIGTQRVVIRQKKERDARRQGLIDRFVNDFAVSREEAEAIAKLNFPQGWEPYSIKALEIFLPELEKGVRFGALLNSLEPEHEAWRNANFPNREQPTGEILDKLPSPRADKHANPDQREEARRIAGLRNPTVVRVQNELRKVVNNLIRLYGKPDLIRVELARQVGKSKREREEMTAAMRKQERRRADARKDLESNGVANPSRDDIEKWLLWKESQERCPYTGDQIGFDDLFRAGRYQTEHIWPRSLSLDDSFRNKTLCRKDVNIAKGNRTPFEFFRGREADWDAVKERVWKMVGRDGMAPGKAKRFIAEKLPEDFASRQLNDTGYAARQAIGFLKRLWPDVGPSAPVSVQAVSGRVTAQLRKLWGLNNILSDDGEKTRADHRHHAIDALTVACAHGGYVKRLSDWFAAAEQGERPHLPEPWPSIRKDAEAAVAQIVVSHRVRKKVSGPLHLETTYGDTGKDVRTKSGTYRLFVTRKPVERLSKSELEEIADDHVRELVKLWVDSHGGDPKKAFASYPRVSDKGPEIRKVRLRSKQQLSLMAPVSTGYADLGQNHHVAIYRGANDKIEFEVLSLFEAAKRLAKHEPVVRRARGDGSTFVMSLAPGDMLHFPSGKMEGHWTVQGAWANGQIVLVDSKDAQGTTVTRPNPSAILRDSGCKVSIDPIGRIRPAND